MSDSHTPPPDIVLPGDRIGLLIAAVRAFYTANGRWPLGTELTGSGPPSSGPGLNPTAVSGDPGAESGPGLNPTIAAAGPPDRAREAPAGVNPTAAGAAPSSTPSERPATRRRPRRRSPR